jgi:hypothetical protein
MGGKTMKLPKRDMKWRYWAATTLLLSAGVAGIESARLLAVALTAVQVVHLAVRERSLRALPVQVRVSYLAILACGLWGPFGWIYWPALAGTSANVIFGYCVLARCLSLFPWNRRAPLSFARLRRTFLTPPVEGSILRALEAGARP